jgi:hypothetical protein
VNVYGYVINNSINYIDPLGLNPAAGAVIGFSLGGPPGAAIGAGIGILGGIIIGDWLSDTILNNDAKAPGKPTPDDGFVEGKDGGPLVPNPNRPGKGYRDKWGNVWCPTGPGSTAHGGPHWDVQTPPKGGKKGKNESVYPGGRRRK